MLSISNHKIKTENPIFKKWKINSKLVNMSKKIKNGYFKISKEYPSSEIYFYQLFDGQKKNSIGKIVTP